MVQTCIYTCGLLVSRTVRIFFVHAECKPLLGSTKVAHCVHVSLSEFWKNADL